MSKKRKEKKPRYLDGVVVTDKETIYSILDIHDIHGARIWQYRAIAQVLDEASAVAAFDDGWELISASQSKGVIMIGFPS